MRSFSSQSYTQNPTGSVSVHFTVHTGTIKKGGILMGNNNGEAEMLIKEIKGKKKRKEAGLWPVGKFLHWVSAAAELTLEFLLWCEWTKGPHGSIPQIVQSWMCAHDLSRNANTLVPHLLQLLVMSVCVDYRHSIFWIKFEFFHADLEYLFISTAFMQKAYFFSSSFLSLKHHA